MSTNCFPLPFHILAYAAMCERIERFCGQGFYRDMRADYHPVDMRTLYIGTLGAVAKCTPQPEILEASGAPLRPMPKVLQASCLDTGSAAACSPGANHMPTYVFADLSTAGGGHGRGRRRRRRKRRNRQMTRRRKMKRLMRTRRMRRRTRRRRRWRTRDEGGGWKGRHMRG